VEDGADIGNEEADMDGPRDEEVRGEGMDEERGDGLVEPWCVFVDEASCVVCAAVVLLMLLVASDVERLTSVLLVSVASP